MSIHRLFESDPEALAELVEVLYRLLVEPAGESMSVSESGAEAADTPTCLSTGREG